MLSYLISSFNPELLSCDYSFRSVPFHGPTYQASEKKHIFNFKMLKISLGETTVFPKKTESVEMPLSNLRSLNKALRGPYFLAGVEWHWRGTLRFPWCTLNHWVVTLSGNRHHQHYYKFRFKDSKAKPLGPTIIGKGDNWGQPKLYNLIFVQTKMLIIQC